MKKSVTVALSITVFLLSVVSLYAGNAMKTPDIITIDSLQDKYEPVTFTHERHVAFAGNCGKCHHQHGNSSALPCKDCHSVAPSAFKQSVTSNFLSCKGCHGKPLPDNPRLLSLKVAYHNQCFECHRGMGNIGLDPKGCAELCHAKKETKVSKVTK